MLRMSTGDLTRYGLQKPDHRFGEAHPTISGRILDRLAHGAVTPKPNIAALDGDTVRFVDGSEVGADLVVYCTGYRITFPFFDKGFVSAPDNELSLYKRVFHPEVAGLSSVGLVQPLGAIMPIAEAQSRWVAEYLLGEYALPEQAAMRADMERERRAMFKRYVASKRHTMQVDFEDYMSALHKEITVGRVRAKKSGKARPIQPCVEQ